MQGRYPPSFGGTPSMVPPYELDWISLLTQKPCRSGASFCA